MNKYAVIYFNEQVYVRSSSPMNTASTVINVPVYVTDGGYTNNIECATRFGSEKKALESLDPKDKYIYSIQHIYCNG